MAKTLSVDLRLRVCAAISEGLSCHEAAARFDVSIASAIRWQAQMRASGECSATIWMRKSGNLDENFLAAM
jgi:transposase